MIGKAVVFLFLLAVIQTEARKYEDTDVDQEWEEFKEFKRWQKARQEKKLKDDGYSRGRSYRKYRQQSKNGNGNFEGPPPIDQAALMGRYIVNQADWTSVATISSQNGIQSFPFVNIVALSDGPLGNGSGIPYLFLTPLDFTGQDITKDSRATLMVTLAQGDYCKQKVWDPMDPRCARIVLTGKIKAVKNTSDEYDVAKNAVFNRHPWLAHMPPNHHFFFAKLKIGEIAVVDYFGGPKYVTVQDYLHPPTPNVTAEFLRQFPIKQTDYSSSDEAYDRKEPGSYEFAEEYLKDPSASLV